MLTRSCVCVCVAGGVVVREGNCGHFYFILFFYRPGLL